MKKNIRQKIELLDREQIKRVLCDNSKKADRINKQHNIISD